MQPADSRMRRFTRSDRNPFLGFALSSEEADDMVATWIGYGHDANDVKKRDNGVWITLSPKTKLQVEKGRVTVHGVVTDDVIAASIRHAQDAWGGRANVHGPEDYKLRAWAHAQVAGVEIHNYTPPPRLMNQAEGLVAKYATEMFNRGLGVYNDGSLDGLSDNRPWGYHPGAQRSKMFEQNQARFRRGGFDSRPPI